MAVAETRNMRNRNKTLRPQWMPVSIRWTEAFHLDSDDNRSSYTVVINFLL